MFVILLRTIILYLVIVLSLRTMGKRQLGELQPTEFVVTILVSNIATLPIENSDIPVLGGIVPIVTLVCCEVFVSMVVLKNIRLRQLISGRPRVVIRDGKLGQKVMEELRYSIDDLMEQLRELDIFDWQEVAFAVMETTGKLTVYKKYSARSLTPEMLGMQDPSDPNAPPVVLISDGHVIQPALTYCNLDERWLEKTLQQEGHQAKDIFLMTCDRRAKYAIVLREG